MRCNDFYCDLNQDNLVKFGLVFLLLAKTLGIVGPSQERILRVNLLYIMSLELSLLPFQMLLPGETKTLQTFQIVIFCSFNQFPKDLFKLKIRLVLQFLDNITKITIEFNHTNSFPYHTIFAEFQKISRICHDYV